MLASKLMLALFPINTSFFKLQINDAELMEVPELSPEVRSEIDLSLSKMEKIVMQQIGETTDGVMLTVAMKHLVVTGNCLVFAGKKAHKVYPLDRYVIERDGDGTVIEIITKELVDRSLLPQGVSSENKSWKVTTPTPLVKMAPSSEWPPLLTKAAALTLRSTPA